MKYQCEYCGRITTNKNEYQCPFCMTTDALHEVDNLYYDEDDEEIDVSSVD